MGAEHTRLFALLSTETRRCQEGWEFHVPSRLDPLRLRGFAPGERMGWR